ncbi:unnamed protein product [Enterobius vermicularis]|uniref:Uncharacterized protein n=1 Tax=Enterobius vermicularis TaxID=51028 RepID=A0A0N4VHY7_ENTVE|nr:unnamed protein product [Enterobius vermicularis]
MELSVFVARKDGIFKEGHLNELKNPPATEAAIGLKNTPLCEFSNKALLQEVVSGEDSSLHASKVVAVQDMGENFNEAGASALYDLFRSLCRVRNAFWLSRAFKVKEAATGEKFNPAFQFSIMPYRLAGEARHLCSLTLPDQAKQYVYEGSSEAVGKYNVLREALIDLFQRKMFEPMSNEQHGSCDIPGSSVTKRRTQESNLEKSRSGLNNITSGGCLSALTGENVFLKELEDIQLHLQDARRQIRTLNDVIETLARKYYLLRTRLHELEEMVPDKCCFQNMKDLKRFKMEGMRSVAEVARRFLKTYLVRLVNLRLDTDREFSGRVDFASQYNWWTFAQTLGK